MEKIGTVTHRSLVTRRNPSLFMTLSVLLSLKLKMTVAFP